MHRIDSIDLERAEQAARIGGATLRKYFARSHAVSSKQVAGESRGLVTTADLEAEQAVVEFLRATCPSDAILAEEQHTETLAENDRIWVIDPLDGTNNFAFGIPHFAISVALWEKGRPKSAAIYQPVSDDWFCAEAGKGAWHNGQPAQVNRHRQLSDTLIGVGFYYDRGAMMAATLSAIDDLFRQQIQGIRRFGAASLDLAYVGVGRFGGYFEYQLAPWDFAAGMLFVEEAGGQTSTPTGETLSLCESGVIATNQSIHADLSTIVLRHKSF